MSFRSIQYRDMNKDSMIILIEGDCVDIPWYNAKKWQRDKFTEALQWGTMKSMGRPNPYELSPVFSHEGFRYRFIIYDDWNPCFIVNLTTGRIREVKYFSLQKERFQFFNEDEFKELGISKEKATEYNTQRGFADLDALSNN
jgi:hypothetical protein